MAIVEGHGEVAAVPVLLRRIVSAHRPDLFVDVPRPMRIPRTKLLKPGELERAVELAGRQTGEADGILILLDAEAECPAEMAPILLARATGARGDRTIRVVLAKREFEAWFLAAAESISGQRSLLPGLARPEHPEEIADAKGWLTAKSQPGTPYSETLDQPALAELFDMNAARLAPSFDKLWRDIAALLSRPEQ